jgi:hypothetical protein
MEWFVAYDWLTLTVSDPTSENGPDGLAANAVIYGQGNLGPSWVGDEDDDVLECNITSDAIRPSSAAFAMVCDASDDAEITLRRGTIGSPGTLVTTFAKCWPANVWIGFSEVTADTSSWYLRISDPGDPSNPVAIEVKFFGIAPRVSLTGSGGAIGRPAQTRAPADLSTHAAGQLGADFASEQPEQFTLTMQVYAHEDTDELEDLWTAIDSVKTVRPILACADRVNATKRGYSVLGRLPALPVAPIEPGMMEGFSLTVVEML